MIDGIDAPAVSRSHAFEVFVEHRLYGRYVLHARLLLFRHLHYLVIRPRLHVQFLFQYIHLALYVRRELCVRHSCQRVIVTDLLRGSHAHAHRYRLCPEDSTVQVVITLGKVVEHYLHLIHLLAEHLHLRRQVPVVLDERRLARRRIEIEEGVEKDHTQTYTSDNIPSRTAEPVTQTVLYPLQLERFGIDPIMTFVRFHMLQFFLYQKKYWFCCFFSSGVRAT